MAVVFLASTSRRLTVLRRLLIFSLRSLRLNNSWPATAFLPGLANACITSFFMIFPPEPDGVIEDGSTFLSAIIAAATGEAFKSLGIEVTGDCVAAGCAGDAEVAWVLG